VTAPTGGAAGPAATDATVTGATAVVRQRCVLVLPSTGEFDSRTYRIASTLHGRGHEVTVVARAAPGLATTETHPAGYRIIRVPVSAAAGLPRGLRWIGRLRGSRVGSGAPAGDVSTGGAGEDEGPTRGGTPSTPPRAAGAVGRTRRVVGGFWRLIAIALSVRAQRIATRAIAPPADLVHAMAYMGIPVGLDLGGRDAAPVIYDARDIYVDAANLARLPHVARRVFAWVERGWAKRASRVLTVNEPYAAVMKGRFGVPKPLIVMNCAYRRESGSIRPRLFHERLGLDSTTPIILYHGGFSRDRGIEQLMEAVSGLPGVTLVLLGYGGLKTILEQRAAEADLAGRVHVLPAVPPAELLDWVASADIVAMPIQPTTLNHRLTTPNKLFEAMAASVPVVASDLPGMAGIVRETGCGILVDPTSTSAIASAICGLLESRAEVRDEMGRRGHEAHLATYNWEAQVAILLAEYGRLTGRPW
jgi:glycogen synthase